MSKANQIQIGGDHYRPDGEDQRQHWDMMYAFSWDYFLCAASKYVDRLGRKDVGFQELRKASHYLQKRIELADKGVHGADMTYHPRDPSLFPATSRAVVVRDLTEWAIARGYSTFQLGFLMLLAVGEYKSAIKLVEAELAKIPAQQVSEGPGRTYVNPDVNQP